MDDSGIRATTRRRFSQLIGGLSIALLGLGATESDARHRRRHKDRDRDKDKDRDKEKRKKRKRRRRNRERCIKVARSCSQTGTSCCNNLRCEDFGRPAGFQCCRPSGYGCSNNRNDECCPGLECVDSVCAHN